MADRWMVWVDEDETAFDTDEQVLEHITRLAAQDAGSFSLMLDHGPRTGWRRWVLGKRDIETSFAVEWDSGIAGLIFSDRNDSEHRAIDSAQPVHPPEDVRLRIAHGELTAHAVDECMDKARAFAAIREYVVSRTRPAWLSYRYVR